MPFNPYASPQSQDASRMPQVGFGQSNPSPQYGGVPNQNAFQNANPAANLYSRFGAPSEGAPLPLPGGAPNSSSSLGIPFGGQPTPAISGYGRPQMPQMGQPYSQFGRFGGPNPMAMQNASPYANLMGRFGGGQMNYLPYMPTGYGMPQNALGGQPNFNYLAFAR